MRLHQTEVSLSPIYFQEGAPLTRAFGGENKNTNHHPKCTCYFPSGVQNWIALESQGNAADGLGLELISPQAVGREVDLAQGASLCEGWWALPGPISGVLEEPSPLSDA